MFEVLEDGPLCACLDFIIKVDALKKICRKTSVIGNERFENTAEHSWHLSLMALVLRGYANQPVKLDKVIKMLIVHDLGEIGVGDTHLYDESRSDAKITEGEVAKNLFSPLPEELREELNSLWKEFAEGTSAESRFARALDRFQPFLSNLANDGGSWKELGITKDKAIAKNRHIVAGSEKLWNSYEILAELADREGLFYKSA